ncbi:uncharacterized protein TRIADDRAFT_33760, partial [Trichoplax adhaerens]
CNQTCVNLVGSYRCQCRSGYRLNADGKGCQDINECLANNGGCSQLCDNTVGSFRCMCRKGYLLDSTEFCRDIDECSRSDDLCQPTQICRNTPSNYYCICRPGLVFMNGRCQLRKIVEQMLMENIDLSTITGLPGFTCGSCPVGFSGNGVNCIGYKCLYILVDINECQVSNGNCGSICVNTIGSYRCTCPSGYYLAMDGRTCQDINECNSTNDCQQICINTMGGYNCSCNTNFALNPDMRTCNDINECLINNGGCSQNCNNTNGGYFCSCRQGYQLDTGKKNCIGSRCESDLNVCSINPEACFPGVTCIDQPASAGRPGYTCGSCPSGMSGNGTYCADINECQGSRHNCSHICVNNIGSYRCTCPKGYYLDVDGKTCKDINECNSANKCQQICNNFPGGYNCTCNANYVLNSDNKTCNDIDECSVNNGGCSYNCLNIAGSYRCLCRPGYKIDANQRTCVGKHKILND